MEKENLPMPLEYSRTRLKGKERLTEELYKRKAGRVETGKSRQEEERVLHRGYLFPRRLFQCWKGAENASDN